MSEKIEYRSGDISNFPQLRILTRFLIGHPGFVAGGCFKHLLSGEKPTDVDMFFRSSKDFYAAVEKFEDSDDYTEVYRNDNTVAFINHETKVRVECIKKIFGSPEQILNQFDFTIVKMAYEIEAEPPEDEDGDWTYNHCVTYHPQFFEHLTMKRLVVDDAMPYPVGTFNRLFKYARYGFFPCRETKMKIITAINTLETIKDSDLSKAMYEGHD